MTQKSNVSSGLFKEFLEYAEKQESKSKDWVTALDTQKETRDFRAQFGATDKLHKVHCNMCGQRQLFHTDEPNIYACRLCQYVFQIVLIKEGPHGSKD